MAKYRLSHDRVLSLLFLLNNSRYKQNKDYKYHQAKQKATCCRKADSPWLEDAINNGVHDLADYGYIVDLLRSKIGFTVVQSI